MFNRFASQNFERRMHIEDFPPLRRATIEWIYSVNANKLVTICMDRQMSPESAERILEQWFCRVHQQMFGASPEFCGTNYMDMHGSCEYGAARDIHYHIVARVPETERSRFDAEASDAWRQTLPASRFHVVDIKEGPDHMFRIARYMTKSCNYTEWWKPHARPDSFLNLH